MKQNNKKVATTTAILPLPDFTWKVYKACGSPKMRWATIRAQWENDCKRVLSQIVWQ